MNKEKFLEFVLEKTKSYGLVPPDITQYTENIIRFEGRADHPNSKSSYIHMKIEGNKYVWLIGDYGLPLHQSGCEYGDEPELECVNYWTKKGFDSAPLGLTTTYTDQGDVTVIPMESFLDDRVSFQTIRYNSTENKYDKLFAKGISTKGLVYVFGEIEQTNTVVFCEGVATAYAVYRACPEFAVVVCFSGSNIKEAIRDFLRKYSDKNIFIGADNDEAGLNYAEDAKEINECITVVRPEKVKSDFCDLYPNIDVIRNYFVTTGIKKVNPHNIIVDDYLNKYPNSFICRYVKSYKKRENERDWLLASALTLVSTASNKQFYIVNDDVEFFPNLYFILLGVSGSGKSTFSGRVSEIWKEAANESRKLWVENSTIASESGLNTHLNNTAIDEDDKKIAVSTVIWDEGSKLFDLVNSKGNTHTEGLSTKLCNLYTNGVREGLSYKRAKKEDNVFIDSCFFNLFINGTPEGLSRSVKMSNVSDGFLPRFLCVFNDAPARTFIRTPEGTKKQVDAYMANKAYLTKCLRDLIVKNKSKKPISIKTTKKADDVLTDLIDKNKLQKTFSIEEFEPFIARFYEMVLKIALLSCLSRENKEIDEEDIVFANSFVYVNMQWTYRSFFPKIEDHKGDKFVGKLKEYLKSHPKGVTKQAISAQRWAKDIEYLTRSRILEDLIRNDEIFQTGKKLFIS